MELSINDLGDVWEAVFDVCEKWYEIGLKLNVPDGLLQCIKKEHSDFKDRLREILREWLKMATERTWPILVQALRSRIVSEMDLASTIETKYCPRPRGSPVPDKVLQKQVEQQQRKIDKLQQQLMELSQPQGRIDNVVMDRKLKQHNPIRYLNWQQFGTAAGMYMCRGTAASYNETAYFNGYDSTTVHAYNSENHQWSMLPHCSHAHSAFIIVIGTLTAVGGLDGDKPTNSLLSLFGEGMGLNWVEHFPPMPTKRYSLTAACNKRNVIVAGGRDGDKKQLNTVEILNTELLQWSTATSLPHPFSSGTATICGDRLYLLGGRDQNDYWTLSVLTCNVPNLLQPQSLDRRLITRYQPNAVRRAATNMSRYCSTHVARNQPSVWHQAANTPHYGSTCVTLCGQLLAVGGHTAIACENTSAVFAYDSTTDSWEPMIMKGMPIARSFALVTILSGDRMMVIGGRGRIPEITTVEIATVL